MFTALRNVQPSHLVDNVLHDFQGLKVENKPVVGRAVALLDQMSFKLKHEESEMIE
jgi:hypothetical protein